jgi:hypothetical protein
VPTTAEPQEEVLLSVVAEDYPENFRPLISATLCESGGYANVWVGFEAVRKRIGNNAAIKRLGWMTYTQFVMAACNANYMQATEANPHSKRIKLIVSNKNSNKSTTEVRSGQHNSRLFMF